jgi:hypothetical protein
MYKMFSSHVINSATRHTCTYSLFVQVCHCQCTPLSHNGPSESIMITTTKTPWWWHVWCAETCCRIDTVWRIPSVLVQLALQSTHQKMFSTYGVRNVAWSVTFSSSSVSIRPDRAVSASSLQRTVIFIHLFYKSALRLASYNKFQLALSLCLRY